MKREISVKHYWQYNPSTILKGHHQTDLNIIRKRAGLNDTKAIDKTTLIDSIQKERSIEFLTEWGHRWLDLKRWGIADNILSTIKAPNWQSTDIFYPIPQAEMNRNTFLLQNAGY